MFILCLISVESEKRKLYRTKQNLFRWGGRRSVPQEFLCYECGDSFTGLRLFNSHLRKHKRARGILPSGRFPCKQCDFKANSQSALTIHMRVHTDERPYQCMYCAQKFRQKGALQSHEMRHTGEKPFQCEFCPKKFIQNSSLTIHRRLHTGERPYKCSICDKGFTDSSEKNVHEKAHFGIKRIRNKKTKVRIIETDETDIGEGQMIITEQCQHSDETIGHSAMLVPQQPTGIPIPHLSAAISHHQVFPPAAPIPSHSYHEHSYNFQ